MFNLIRNADVEVIAHRDAANNPIVLASINGNEHRFAAASRVSRSLEMMAADEVAERLTGGSYFFIEDKLVDFRDGQYSRNNGFVHTDDSINHLMCSGMIPLSLSLSMS